MTETEPESVGATRELQKVRGDPNQTFPVDWRGNPIVLDKFGMRIPGLKPQSHLANHFHWARAAVAEIDLDIVRIALRKLRESAKTPEDRAKGFTATQVRLSFFLSLICGTDLF